MQTIVASKKINSDHLLGQFLDESHYDTVVDSDTMFYIENNSLDEELNEDRIGFVFIKNYFPKVELTGAYEGLARVADGMSNNRGLAAGPKKMKIGNRDWVTAYQEKILATMMKGKTPLPGYDPIQEILDEYEGRYDAPGHGNMWLIHSTVEDEFNWHTWLEETRKLPAHEQKAAAEFVEDRYISTSTYANHAHSGVAGFFDRYPRYPYVRPCAYNREHPEQFAKAFPYLKRLSEAFSEYLPTRYANQKRACESIDHRFVLPGTVFTTVTVNKSFQTAAHLDAGDLGSGFSNLSVITDGKSDFTGGLLVLPEYRTAINLRPGDLLLVANHSIIHGNTPIDGHRISVVCYFREGLIGTGSKEYEDARYEFIEMRKADPVLCAGRNQFNGVLAGWENDPEWFEFCKSKIGEEETYRMHPNAKPKAKSLSLEDMFDD
jgi:hypothetical protein